MTNETLSWEMLLAAYASGYFPMAERRDDPELHWFQPEQRGIIALDDFHIPRSLAKLIRKQPFDITIDQAFPQVIAACADRPETWINRPIERLFTQLWEHGFAHSIECRRGGELMGGLYGLALCGAFFAESMFSTTSGASKIALAFLVERLRSAGYSLLDVQYTNPHLEQFGVREIGKEAYMVRLEEALLIKPGDAFQ